MTLFGANTDPAVSHPTVKMHPTSHHVMVAYRGTDGQIKLYVLNAANGQILNNYTIATAGLFGFPTDCTGANCGGGNRRIPKCGNDCNSSGCGGTGCMHTVDKIYMDTKLSGGNVYLYLTYNYLCPTNGPDAKKHMKAYVGVFKFNDIAVAPTSVKSWGGSSTCGSTNDNNYSPVVLAHPGANQYGWGYYRQANGNPCDTYFHVLTWNAANLASASKTGDSDIDGPFPTALDQNFQTFKPGWGYGDYNGAMPLGIPTSALLFTYGKTVNTSVTCTTCSRPGSSNTKWSMAYWGARVTP